MKKTLNLLKKIVRGNLFGAVSNVYWWNNSWTAPCDGMMILRINPSNNALWYWYVRDTAISGRSDVGGWSHQFRGATNGTKTYSIPVKKGATFSTEGLSNINSIQCLFYPYIIGGGYGLTSILSRLSAIFRDWRWRHEESTETDEGYFNISQRGEGNKRGMHRLQTGELPNTQDRDGLTVVCNIESNRLSIIGGGISCKDLQRLNICGLRNLREYERAGARRDNGGHGCARSTVRIPNTEIRLVLRGIGGISERRCVA